ncbi:transcriptional regulator, MucR family [Sphingomonas gellani]|uniref:Transcriptional regulator, MucR family n=1 Tax=Sphingomonas gellani TaxID=1166340 RepID=A0A1H8C8E0_9SPHN|nr:MucR family transcriptional regulator [Sphingomonas gellani]SEM90357.1 transcriptional regulator, MucR family [Sphingomonas gellani]
MTENPDLNAVELATELTIAWLGNPNTRTSSEEVPAFLGKMHDTVSALLGSGGSTEQPAEQPTEYVPAVTARKSLASKDHIISMIDGKPYKTLRRHLATNGLTPAEYRDRYGLKPDYPMVAENYSESRRAMAKKIGLGRKPGQRSGGEAAEGSAPAARRRKAPATEA